ncbi:hypothetical protein F2P56_019633, partial [Juglans regia]
MTSDGEDSVSSHTSHRMINPSDDSSSPYYLHPSDNPGALLVSEIFTGDNYIAWSRSITIALTVKNKAVFIDGTILAPPVNQSILHTAWLRANNLVLSWLMNSISKDIRNSLLYVASAVDLWKELKTRYLRSDGPRVFHLEKSLSSITQDSLSITEYFSSFKTLWDEYINYRPFPTCSCGKMATWKRNPPAAHAATSTSELYIQPSNDNQKFSLTSEEFHKLLALANSNFSQISTQTTSPAVNIVTSQISGKSLNPCYSVSSSLQHVSSWILDTGATDHMDQSTKKMIGIAFEKHGLYHLSQAISKDVACTQPNYNSSSFVSAITLSQLDPWHHRLGHVSNSRLPFLKQLEPSISFNSSTVCD